MPMASIRDTYAGVGVGMLAASQLAQLNQLNQLGHHHLIMHGQSAQPAPLTIPPPLDQGRGDIPPGSHSPPISRTYTYKKVTKPLLERKRRARINRCLDELKELMVGALEAEGENVSKLEKADILELTVRHLQRITRPRNAAEDANTFQAGFSQCASEACQFLIGLPGLDAGVGRRLVAHLSQVVSGIPTYSPPTSPHSPRTPGLPPSAIVPSTSTARSPPPEVSSTTCSTRLKREADDSTCESDPSDAAEQDAPVNYTSEALRNQQQLEYKRRSHKMPRLESVDKRHHCVSSSDDDDQGPMWRPW